MKSLFSKSLWQNFVCLVVSSAILTSGFSMASESQFASQPSTQPLTNSLADGADNSNVSVLEVEGHLKKVLNSELRSEENRARDAFRNPEEVIKFFEIKPSDHVLEVWPGNGWYSEILAPYLKAQGKLTAATFSLDNLNSKDKRHAFWSKISREYIESMSDHAVYGLVNFTEYQPPVKTQLAPDNSVDVALIIRSLHVWDEEGFLLSGLKDVYRALKPGGTLAIIQHRADSTSENTSTAVEGYLTESYVIKAAENAGFIFESSSEINANPKDTKDYLRGVYTLPPTLAMGAAERAKYLDIGESDRMTLKFVKRKSREQ